jgi:hypothetical protein
MCILTPTSLFINMQEGRRERGGGVALSDEKGDRYVHRVESIVFMEYI